MPPTGSHLAPTPRKREHWYVLWLLAQGWSAAQVARALERDAHTIGEWGRPSGRQERLLRLLLRPVAPPALQPEQQTVLKTALNGSPQQSGVPLANWTWCGVQQFVRANFRLELSWNGCLRYLRRLGFFTVAYTISWLLWLPLVAAAHGLLPSGGVSYFHLLGSLGSLAAAIIITASCKPKAGLRALFARMVRWRVGVVWWMIALLFPAALSGLAAVLLRLSSGSWPD